MLTGLVAHVGEAVGPVEVWSAWSLDPAILLGAATMVALAGCGQRNTGTAGPPNTALHPASRRRVWRYRSFVAGVVTVLIALVSPLDAMSSSLASAHMVQHLLLVLVAAPLFVVSSPLALMARGLPSSARRHIRMWRRRPVVRLAARVVDHPVAVSLLHVLAIWFWHASGPYEAALNSRPVHVVEHGSFLATALLSWAAIAATARRQRVLRRRRVPSHVAMSRDRSPNRTGTGLGVLVLFGLAVQSSILGALLTFASGPWYETFESTTSAWGLTPLADQQLAALIMRVPAGGLYLLGALALLRSWIDPPRQTWPAAPRANVERLTGTGAAGAGGADTMAAESWGSVRRPTTSGRATSG